MDDTSLSPDSVSAAGTYVTEQKARLEAARKTARASRSRDDWLAERQDLLRPDRIIRDYPRRQSQLADVEREYQNTYEQRLAEKERECPYLPSAELAGEYERLTTLARALQAASDADLRVLLNDPRLNDTDKKFIKERIQPGNRPALPLHALDRPSNQPRGWAQYVESVNKDLRTRERELVEQRRDHAGRLRLDLERELLPLKEQVERAMGLFVEAESALEGKREIDDYVDRRIEAFANEETREEQAAYEAALQMLEEAKSEAERARWAAIATHPIADVVRQLPDVPDEHIIAVMDRLLALPATDPHIHDPAIHEFLLAHRESADRHDDPAPVVVACVGRLGAMGEVHTAREILDRCPAADGSPLGGVVAYLSYVLREAPDLSGLTEYRSLTPDDLFLGACYYEGDASATLKQQSHWDYPSLEHSLRAGTNDDDEKHFHDFLVRGLQPRIAELAFREIVGRLRGENGMRGLRDLNAEGIAKIPRTLPPQPSLPSTDWEDGDGNHFDVKCNLFFPSHHEKNGLRGFLLKLKDHSDEQCSYPAFVFTEKTKECCRWVYVGEYRPGTAARELQGNRILPFYCRLPDEVRFVPPNTNIDLDVGTRLLKDRFLRLGWRLAFGRPAVPGQAASTTDESFLDDVVDRCVRVSTTSCLEYAIWRTLTEATFDACTRGNAAAVRTSLELAKQFIASRAFPVRLPRIGGRPILSQWIDQVLKPLAEHWDSTRCPRCKGRSIRLGITRMTSQGTILGGMTCEGCGAEADEVTLLTHCYNCFHYPLIIGKNHSCAECDGLICEWLACGCCKRDDCGRMGDTR